MKYREMALRSAKLFELVTGHPVRVLTHVDLPFIKGGQKMSDGVWGKCFCWDFVGPSVDRIFYFDADVAAQHPLGILPEAKFLASRDLPASCKHALVDAPDKLKNVTQYFNAGIFLASRETLTAFDEAKRQFPSRCDWGYFKDQNCLNALIQEHCGGWTEFPSGFSNTPGMLDGPGMCDFKLVHYAGLSWEAALSATERKLDELKRMDRDRLEERTKIIRFENARHLGDTIKALTVAIAHIRTTCNAVVLDPDTGNVAERIRELLDAFDIPEPVRKKLILGHSGAMASTGNGVFPDGYLIDTCAWVPTQKTKKQWTEPCIPKIAYQFDGMSSASLKNPPDLDVELFLEFRREAGLKTVRLGKHLTIAECVAALASSSLFVGVDSGMAQISYCTGTPTYIAQYRMGDDTMNSWHRNKAKVIYPTLRHFLRCGPQLIENAKSRVSGKLLDKLKTD